MGIRLGSGKYDALSGRYIDPADDLDALVKVGGEVPGAALGVVLPRP